MCNTLTHVQSLCSFLSSLLKTCQHPLISNFFEFVGKGIVIAVQFWVKWPWNECGFFLALAPIGDGNIQRDVGICYLFPLRRKLRRIIVICWLGRKRPPSAPTLLHLRWVSVFRKRLWISKYAASFHSPCCVPIFASSLFWGRFWHHDHDDNRRGSRKSSFISLGMDPTSCNSPVYPQFAHNGLALDFFWILCPASWKWWKAEWRQSANVARWS